jgi:hypothetical protein
MTVVFPSAAMTSVRVLFPTVIASLALRAEMALAAAVAVVGGDAPVSAHPVTQVQTANTTRA